MTRHADIAMKRAESLLQQLEAMGLSPNETHAVITAANFLCWELCVVSHKKSVREATDEMISLIQQQGEAFSSQLEDNQKYMTAIRTILKNPHNQTTH